MSVSQDVGCVDHICLWNGGSQGLVGACGGGCVWRGGECVWRGVRVYVERSMCGGGGSEGVSGAGCEDGGDCAWR